MKNFTDKEYHPVIEDFICNYAESTLDLAERDAFEEVLAGDEDLRELAFSAKEGKKLLDGFVKYIADQVLGEHFFFKMGQR